MKIVNGKNHKNEENGKYYIIFDSNDGLTRAALIFKIGVYINDTDLEISKVVFKRDEHDMEIAIVHPMENEI